VAALRLFGKILKWTLIGLGSLLALLVIASVVVVALGITISAAPWRERIAAQASQALGRPVRLEGPLELVPTLRPLLKVGGVHIANPSGFSQPEFASLGEAHLQIDLHAALRGQLLVREISANEVHARLERTAEGRANWGFDLPAQPPQQQGQAGPARVSDFKDLSFAVNRIILRRLNVEYYDGATDRSRYFELEELSGEVPKDKPVKLALHGSVEKSFPYTVTVTGGPGSDLLRAANPWPFEVSVDFLGTLLRISGSLSQQGRSGQLIFGMGTEDLSQIERLLQTRLPKVGATGLGGVVHWEPGKASIAPINGIMGRTTLEGQLAFDYTGKRPRISGQLTLPNLDLRPFLSAEKAPSETPPRSLSEVYRQLEKATFSLRELTLLDVDVDLAVGQWLSLPGDVREARLEVHLHDGLLRAPVSSTVAGVQLSGQVEVDGVAKVPSFTLQLGTQRTSLGGLAELLFGLEGIDGQMGRFSVQVGARGDSGGELVRSLDVRLNMARSNLTYGNVEGGRPVEFTLETLDMRVPPGRDVTARMRGTLLGERFAADLRSGDLPTIASDQRVPLKLTASGPGATLTVDGTIATPGKQTGTDLAFRLSGRRAGELSSWLGVSPKADAPVLIEGRARVEADEWRLSGFRVRLGRSALHGELARIGIGVKLLIRAKLDVDLLDVVELETIRPPNAEPPRGVQTRDRGATLDLPILPAGIDLSDADVEVKVKRVALKATDVTDASFSGRIREGRMTPSPFAATIAAVPFSGALALDLRGQVPEASLWVAANDVDVGRLLRNFKVVQDLDASVESLRVQLIGRGSRLGEMLERSALELNLDGGHLTMRDVKGKPLVEIALKTGVASAQPEQPVTLTLDGAIDQTPVAIRVSSGTLIDFLRVKEYVPFALSAQAAGAQLDLKGRVALPITSRSGELRLLVEGERLDSMNKLAHVELPPWGPWSFGGSFRASPRGYEVPDLEVHVGGSGLNGHGTLNVAGTRPRLDVSLAAPRVQLDDFQFGTWSPFEKKEQKAEKHMSVEEMRAKAKEGVARAQKLLSRETLLRADAFVDVAVEQVRSGADQLGSGKLHAQLENARLEFGPATVNVPGGSADLKFSYEPTVSDVVVGAQIRVDRFDYGILARRIKPQTDLQGLFSLNVDIEGRAPTLDAVMAHANGRIDFAVWPKNMRAGIFDLWAVNLFVALVPAVDPAKESKVNCALGRFNLQDGKLTQDAILMDTSRMRVTGEGGADFGSESVHLRLAPKPKSPQFFSLATPVQVNGSFTHFKVGVAPGGVAETIARQLFSLILVPIQKLTEKKIPRDGADICSHAIREALMR
jgi:uncharacterized protein involved in outer membrane biogenesis